ncbi:MAG TPA: ABC transporter ATP-binding protein [Tepidisphaeraceae bacterium]|jgi:ABC-type dipeptide/oligopeptide/nickel transport system ATPase component
MKDPLPNPPPAYREREQDIVLSVRDLRVVFDTVHGTTKAVRGVSFDLPRGQTLALVGESGSGKSVTSYSILRLIQKPGRIDGGQILYKDKAGKVTDIAKLDEKSDELYRIRGGKISMIFQEPMTALSPVHTVGDQVTEAILLHRKVDKKQADDIAADMLAKVGITDVRKRLKQYPFEFSGGMRQRVVIAIALVCQPDVLIADEPTTALDVTVQAQILRLIDDLREQMGTSVLFITHDLGVVAQIADKVAVMKQGMIVERASARHLFKEPLHPYTQELLAAVSFEHDRLNAEQCTPAFATPDGYQFDEPVDPSAVPLLHDMGDERHLLLWPNQMTQERSV